MTLMKGGELLRSHLSLSRHISTLLSRDPNKKRRREPLCFENVPLGADGVEEPRVALALRVVLRAHPGGLAAGQRGCKRPR